MTPIPIVFATDNNYAQHLAVAIASLLENNPGEAFDLYIIPIEVNQEHRNRFRTLVENKPGVKLTFLEFDRGSYAHFPTNGHITWAAYSRLFIPGLLDPKISKVIYLDCDLYIADSIRPLWEIDLGHHALGAVANPFADRKPQLGRPANKPCINSGVLLMNLDVWRAEGLTEKIIAYIDKNSHLLTLLDQDAINGFLYDRILDLEARWNVHHTIFEESSQSLNLSPEAHLALKTRPGIVHFTSDRKPWLALNTHPYRKYYWKSLHTTPYRDYRAPLGSVNKALPEKYRPHILLKRLRGKLLGAK